MLLYVVLEIVTFPHWYIYFIHFFFHVFPITGVAIRFQRSLIVDKEKNKFLSTLKYFNISVYSKSGSYLYKQTFLERIKDIYLYAYN